jgi:cobalt/nickel transport system permease protein
MLPSPAAMHIPDGFLSIVVAVTAWMLSLLVVGYALKRVSADLGERQVPLMGVLAAAVFAGQMLNFSVTGGTSGHLIGASLVTALLGPWAGVLVMTCVVSIQALIFQDGGLLTLGANLLNMAVISVAVAYFTYRSLRRLAGDKPWGLVVAGFGAGWLSVFITSLACALELALSGTSPANVAVPAMAGIHALIGIGEGLITAGALAFLRTARPELVTGASSPAASGKALWVGGLATAVVLAAVSPLASAHPDGLEWVAEQHGFLRLARGPVFDIIPDYAIPGLSNEALATILAGIVGVVMVFGTALGLAYLRRRRASVL